MITEAIKEQITNKFGRLEKYFDSPETVNVYVNIKINTTSQIIEVTIPTSKFTIRAEESHADLYAAIDLVVDKLERQIRKNKKRLKDKYKNTENFALNLDFEIANEEENDTKIVKRKTLEMKPMDEEEAILQAELLGYDFFVFKNIDAECISILYKRKDEKYGIINVN